MDEAVERANRTNYGLGGSVWGEKDAANEVSTRIDSGMVWVNDHMAQSEAVPFLGIKGSGVGSEGGGAIGLREFVDMRTYKFAK